MQGQRRAVPPGPRLVGRLSSQGPAWMLSAAAGLLWLLCSGLAKQLSAAGGKQQLRSSDAVLFQPGPACCIRHMAGGTGEQHVARRTLRFLAQSLQLPILWDA